MRSCIACVCALSSDDVLIRRADFVPAGRWCYYYCRCINIILWSSTARRWQHLRHLLQCRQRDRGRARVRVLTVPRKNLIMRADARLLCCRSIWVYDVALMRFVCLRVRHIVTECTPGALTCQREDLYARALDAVLPYLNNLLITSCKD